MKNNFRQKPNIREKVEQNGAEFVSNEELIMLLLGSGTKTHDVRTLAKNVLEHISDEDDNIMKRLQQVSGIGPGKAATIAAALELGRRVNGRQGFIIKKPVDIIPMVQHYAMQKQEHFLCASLNGAHEILKIRVISLGTLNRSLIHPREIFADVLKERAAAIILCHNHPSGNVQPSTDDIEATIRLLDASILLGIQLLDHIIIAQNTYYSFLEEGLLQN